MHLIYVDESGDDGFKLQNGSSPFFIRTALIVHDWKWHQLNQALSQLKFSKKIPASVEIHATEILNGGKNERKNGVRQRKLNWFGSNFPNRDDRIILLKEIIHATLPLEFVICVAAIDKTKIKQTHPNFKMMPKEKSWEFLIERANLYLNIARDKKAMIISDASGEDIDAKQRAFAEAKITQSAFINEAHFIETILFEGSHFSNLLQIVDVIAFAYGRKFSFGDDQFSSLLDQKLLTYNGGVDGAGMKVWPI